MSALTLTSDWPEYELLDSGNGEKLERVGPYRLRRPEPRAIWKSTLSETEWNNVSGHYIKTQEEKGRWEFNVPQKEWDMKWNSVKFTAKPTSFKHIGVFPEQEPLWSWIAEKIIQANRPTKILNLFAYTGGATLACMAAGATVTHVDSSHDVVTWAHDNVKKSGMEDKPVRWIVDDVVKFVRREAKRGVQYDGIIMDPPKFGRGTSGQVWKIESDLPELVERCAEILSSTPLFFIITAYAIDYSSIMLNNILRQNIGEKGMFEHGELTLKQSSNSFYLPTSIFARWSSTSGKITL